MIFCYWKGSNAVSNLERSINWSLTIIKYLTVCSKVFLSSTVLPYNREVNFQKRGQSPIFDELPLQVQLEELMLVWVRGQELQPMRV